MTTANLSDINQSIKKLLMEALHQAGFENLTDFRRAHEEVLGVSPETLRRLFHEGRRIKPSTLQAVCQALNLPGEKAAEILRLSGYQQEADLLVPPPRYPSFRKAFLDRLIMDDGDMLKELKTEISGQAKHSIEDYLVRFLACCLAVDVWLNDRYLEVAPSDLILLKSDPNIEHNLKKLLPSLLDRTWQVDFVESTLTAYLEQNVKTAGYVKANGRIYAKPSNQAAAKVFEIVEQVLSSHSSNHGAGQTANHWPTSHKIPVISYVSAGEPAQWTDGGYVAGQGFDWAETPPGVSVDQAGRMYVLRIRGDSMFPLKEGTDLYILPESRKLVRNQDLVVFKDSDFNAWVKIYYEHGDVIVLKSLNTNYTDIIKKKSETVLLEKIVFIKPA
ncbi:MAG: helix-turn-helix transcriptional regulator [Deltaproteobacteria bacterium]|nr:helix-turn-helix transcriptional regulator [Deltaproteobacteria bacterium]